MTPAEITIVILIVVSTHFVFYALGYADGTKDTERRWREACDRKAEALAEHHAPGSTKEGA